MSNKKLAEFLDGIDGNVGSKESNSGESGEVQHPAEKKEQYVCNIVNCLQEVSSTTGHSKATIFRKWIDLITYAFEFDDDRYLNTLENITTTLPESATKDEEDVVQKLAEGFAIVCTAMEKLQQPILGDVYQEIGANSDSLGQYFTPWNVCKLGASLQMTTAKFEDRSVDNPITIHDPTCGSSRMQLAAAKKVHQERPELPVMVSGIDKSDTCAKMSVINLVLAGQSGWIAHGDSLTMDIYKKWTIDMRTNVPCVKRISDPEQHETQDDQ